MKRKKKTELPEWDDGRTIVNMDVEGTLWYSGPKQEKQPGGQNRGNTEPMSREEARIYTWGALKAALFVVGAFCLGLTAFVAFCVFVWFR